MPSARSYTTNQKVLVLPKKSTVSPDEEESVDPEKETESASDILATPVSTGSSSPTTAAAGSGKPQRTYFTTADLATIAIFAALQFILQYFAGKITFLPGAERPIVAFPVAFMAALTYLRTRKIGAVGLTTLIAGIIMVSISAFMPVIFEWVGATIGVEIVIIAAHKLCGKARTWSICTAAGALMLGRGIGVTIGLEIFLPAGVASDFASLAAALLYITFNGIIPFAVAFFGAWVAIKLAINRKLVPKDVFQ
jgi:hypothetical protein